MRKSCEDLFRGISKKLLSLRCSFTACVNLSKEDFFEQNTYSSEFGDWCELTFSIVMRMFSVIYCRTWQSNIFR